MVAAVDARGPTIVELVGPAGAGKTTLARALVAAGVRPGAPPPRRAYAVALVTGAVRLLPALVEHRGSSRWFGRGELRSIAYLDAWHRQVRRGREVILFDQGPVYRLAFLKEFGPDLVASRSFTTWWSAALERWAQTLDLVVLLDAPDEVLIDRVNERGRSHAIKEADDRAARDFLARYRSAFDEVVGAMAVLGGPEIVVFDTAATVPDEVERAVAARLAPLAGGRVG